MATTLVSLASLARADQTVTSYTTRNVVAIATVTEYIWTNTDGQLTSTAITGSERYVPATATGSLPPQTSTVLSFASPVSINVPDVNVPSQTKGSSSASSLSFSSATPSSGLLDSAASTPSTHTASTSTDLSSAASASGASKSAVITTAPTTVPAGSYSTSISRTTTTLSDGSAGVIEYVVLFTNTCQSSSSLF